MKAQKTNKPSQQYPDLVNLLVDINIKTRELHDLTDQTNIAKVLGLSKQAIQQKALRRAAK